MLGAASTRVHGTQMYVQGICVCNTGCAVPGRAVGAPVSGMSVQHVCVCGVHMRVRCATRVHSSCSAARVQRAGEPALHVCARMYMHWTWLCIYVHVHTWIAHGCAFMHIYIARGCACMHTYMHCTWLCVCSTLDVHSVLQWGKAVQTGSSAGVRKGAAAGGISARQVPLGTGGWPQVWYTQAKHLQARAQGFLGPFCDRKLTH